MSITADQIVAMQAVADNLGISQVFDAKAYHLFYSLNIINIGKSDTTCLGLCSGKRACLRHVAREDAIKGLLGLIRVVFDPEIQEEDLRERLEDVCWHLLCKQHQNAHQYEAKEWVERNISVVEEVRRSYGVHSTKLDLVDGFDCVGCVDCMDCS